MLYNPKNCSLNVDPSHITCIINLLLFLATFYVPKCTFSFLFSGIFGYIFLIIILRVKNKGN